MVTQYNSSLGPFGTQSVGYMYVCMFIHNHVFEENT